MRNPNNTQFVRIPNEPRIRNWKHNCEQCGQEFYSVRKDAKYCSSYCKTAHRREKIANQPAAAAAAPPATKQKKAEWKTKMSWSCYNTDWRYNDDVKAFREYLRSKYKIGKVNTTTYPATLKALSNFSNIKLVREKKTGYIPVFTMYESVH